MVITTVIIATFLQNITQQGHTSCDEQYLFNIAQALFNLIYQVVGYLRLPKALQIRKNLTQFMASDSPVAHRSLACVMIKTCGDSSLEIIAI